MKAYIQTGFETSERQLKNATPQARALTLLNITTILKGIIPQFGCYCSNLIFWIIMGCGIAHFGRRGLENHLNLKMLVLEFVPNQY